MSISVQKLKSLDKESYQIIDVRNEIEAAHGIMPGAVRLKAEEIENSEWIDKSKKLVICCSRGQFSIEAAERLKEKGFDAQIPQPYTPHGSRRKEQIHRYYYHHRVCKSCSTPFFYGFDTILLYQSKMKSETAVP